MSASVGLAGLGAMGAAMAVHLHEHMQTKHGKLHVWNRTGSAASVTELRSKGAVVHESLRTLVGSVDVLFVMLTNDTACTQVAGEIAEHVVKERAATAPPLVFVNSSTIYPTTSTDIAAQLAKVNVRYVGAPVFGRPEAVKAKQAVLVYGGPSDLRPAIEPLLQAMGRAVLAAGQTAEQANVLKLTGNFMIASIIEQIAEASTLGEKNGLSRETFMTFIETMIPAPSYKAYGSLITHENYEPAGFPVKTALKDVGHMRRLAEASGTPLPLGDLIWQHLLAAQNNGDGDKDWSSIASVVRQHAGIAPKH